MLCMFGFPLDPCIHFKMCKSFMQNVQERHSKCEKASLKMRKSFVMQNVQELSSSKMCKSFFMQNVQELSPLNMCKSLLTYGPILQAQQLQETTTTDVQGHHLGGNFPSLFFKCLRVLNTGRHAHSKKQETPDEGTEATHPQHTRCIQDPCESIKVLLAPTPPATSPPASLSSI